MSKAWIAAPLLSLALIAAAAFSAPPAASMAPRCEVRITTIPEGLRIDGVVHGRPGKSGFYQLLLEKSGHSGSSQVSQGGAFTIPAGAEAVVSESEFNIARGDAYRITMAVTGSAGTTHCDQRAP